MVEQVALAILLNYVFQGKKAFSRLHIGIIMSVVLIFALIKKL